MHAFKYMQIACSLRMPTIMKKHIHESDKKRPMDTILESLRVSTFGHVSVSLMMHQKR